MSQAASWIRDAGDADFEREVLDRSFETPVVVDFWAPWCGPCRALGPLLERLADEHAGAFVLVKVNVDESPVVAQQFGVRSIPAVLGFRDGAVAGEFVGAQPESVVRQLLERVLPTEADLLARQGEERLAAGDAAGAEASLRRAVELDARHPRALLALARLLGGRSASEEALDLLDRMPASSPLAAEAERLAAEIRTRTEGDLDEAGLRARVSADPDDLAARLDLGRALAARGSYDDALAEWLAVVQRDASFADEAARKAMLDVFAVLGSDHPTTSRFRAELARALYR